MGSGSFPPPSPFPLPPLPPRRGWKKKRNFCRRGGREGRKYGLVHLHPTRWRWKEGKNATSAPLLVPPSPLLLLVLLLFLLLLLFALAVVVVVIWILIPCLPPYYYLHPRFGWQRSDIVPPAACTRYVVVHPPPPLLIPRALLFPLGKEGGEEGERGR